ncbi:ATP-binding cassette domain-containing protein [Heliobacillus mobilis]|uniref:ATP-binding cassette domain-containing protein n=1 Tax=Heliobacterium mobile TaxID=28064 RepID=A0A6I3SH72_HELMO|nr:ABC transporter ATP-binding protein [Heliobacterium mobile]MTV48204.1 ATP-binding cassette domain-containing protein [Heliobacterium mobile]
MAAEGNLITPTVRLEGVGKTYQTGTVAVEALKEVSLDVYAGDYLAIMGPSGSGKSTLMNILGCLDRPTAGRYLLDGQDVATLDDRQLARIRNSKLGFVFQNFQLLPRVDALNNVELPMIYAGINAKERQRRAESALTRVGLVERMGHKPNELSGGQKQRVAIARALVNQPLLLLADEPTGNLDSKTSIEIMEIFQALNNEGTTIIMITHEPDIAAYARTVVTCRDGRITLQRGHSE